MGSLNPSPELTFDFRPSFIPKTIDQFLGEVSRISNVKEKLLQVDDFVKRLETETRKIESFKDLPLCMLLINDAIYALMEESVMLKKTSNPEPVLEEFIPLKNNSNADSELKIIEKQKENSDKKNWLSSTQLWNTNENSEEEDTGIKNPKIPCSTPNLQSNIRNGCTPPPSPPSLPLPPPPQQMARKQRRCWSTELHRRFIAALQELGGSQAATPKQIRELMQVDGLTNDEVKSHLQKYRLHSRRLPSSNTNQYVGFSKCSNSQLDSPNGPLMNGGDNMVDDEEDEKSDNYCWN